MKFRDFHKKSGFQSTAWLRSVFQRQPPPFKEYPRFASVALPEPRAVGMPLGEAMMRRTSSPAFDPVRPLSLGEVGGILHLAAGINAGRAGQVPHRYHPSGGSLYPLEWYVAAFRVEGLARGLYHYAPQRHALESLPLSSDFGELVSSVPQHGADSPAAVCIITGRWGRNYLKYGEFAYRLTLAEAGHAAQNALLSATALSVDACPIMGFHEERIAKILDIMDDDEDPLYLVFLGKKLP